MQILFEYPSWFFLLCLVAGAVYAGALYLSDRLNAHFSRRLIILLGFLRFSVVSTLSFFLLGPLIKSVQQDVVLPVIAVVADNSESLGMVTADTTFQESLNNLAGSLGKEYDVRFFSFDKELSSEMPLLSLDRKGTSTDISVVYKELNARYANLNLGAVVLATDGIYNRGMSPEFSAQSVRAPTFVIALGDTARKKDAFIEEVLFNTVSYLGNKFPLHIEVGSHMLKGKGALLTVSSAGKELYRNPVVYDGEHHVVKFTTYIQADKPGTVRYDISLSPVSGELTAENNFKSIFVEVIDSRQKILLLGEAPHPDVAAIKAALEKDENYEVITAWASDFKGNAEEYDLIVFHNLPGLTAKGIEVAVAARDKHIPCWFVVGPSTNFSALNDLKIGFAFTGVKAGVTQISARLNDGFSLFLTDEATGTMMGRFPPLQGPFAELEVSNAYSSFAYQRIGNVATTRPIIAFDSRGEVKRALTAGEGLWRWRLFDYAENKTHNVFDGLVSKTVRFLASKDDKSRFRIEVSNRFEENEEVRFKARLFNDSFELTNSPEVNLTIINEAGKEFDYVFARTGDIYALNCGKLPEGNYTFEGKTVFNSAALKKAGTFSVSKISVELNKTVADHAMLNRLASNTGGQLLGPEQVNQLSELIKARTDISSVSYERSVTIDLISKWWIMILLLMLLSGEWVLRKWSGAY